MTVRGLPRGLQPDHQRLARYIVALATRSRLLSASAIALALAGATLVTYLQGGTHTAMPHLYYLPVVIAASRFRQRGALVVAVAAGLLAGPLMPLNVAQATAQATVSWLIRLAFFVAVGQTVALLCHRPLSGLRSAIADGRIKAGLEQALANDQLRVVYQPQFDLGTQTLTGFEALVRWDRADGTTVPPAQFIDAAERTGVIVAIDRFVLETAAAQLARWRAQPHARGLKMAVNVSARRLDRDDVVAHVDSVLRETGVPASALELEVTETALITDLTAVSQRVQDLRALGVSVAVDDFGTGQSSLAYLHRFRVDVIKIDRSFVSALETDGHARAVAHAVVQLAVGLAATTVAEGIETAGQAEILRGMGCELGQGYHFGRPLDTADAEALVACQPQARPGPAAAGGPGDALNPRRRQDARCGAMPSTAASNDATKRSTPSASSSLVI